MNKAQDRVLTLDEAAEEYLHVKSQTARKISRLPGFPAKRIPGFRRILVPERELLEWISAQAKGGAIAR